MRAAFQIQAEIDVFGEIVFDALPTEIACRNRSARSEDKVNPNQRNRQNN